METRKRGKFDTKNQEKSRKTKKNEEKSGKNTKNGTMRKLLEHWKTRKTKEEKEEEEKKTKEKTKTKEKICGKPITTKNGNKFPHISPFLPPSFPLRFFPKGSLAISPSTSNPLHALSLPPQPQSPYEKKNMAMKKNQNPGTVFNHLIYPFTES